MFSAWIESPNAGGVFGPEKLTAHISLQEFPRYSPACLFHVPEM
jgi:hypothetical protein